MSTESDRFTDQGSTTAEERDTQVVDLRGRDDEIRRDEGAEPIAQPPAGRADGGAGDDDSTREPLLSEGSANGYRQRWEQIQARFVDDPRSSVEQADSLVNDVVRELEASFGSEREALEAQWQRGEDVETENLRVVLRRYRSFFGRLLTA